MHSLGSLNPTLGFAAGIAVALLILVALELYNGRRVTKLTQPMYEFTMKRAEGEAEKILQEAQEQARRIISAAEAGSMTATATKKKETEAAEQVFESTLKSMLENWEARIGESAKSATQMHGKLAEQIESEFRKEADTAKTQLASTMSTLQEELRKRLEELVAAAVESARKEATNYQQMQKTSVDAHVLALVRETLRITLQRDFPKEVHAELVRAALEEAKASGVF